MPHILYLTRNGLLEPLGQSQVLAYLRGLADEFHITVISFEKPEDLSNAHAVRRLRGELSTLGIAWWPQRFRYRPKLLAPAVSIVRLLILGLRGVGAGTHLIHARSYLPAFAGLLVHRLTSVPFIFDMRGLWPEELITARKITRGSFIHRLLERFERACLGRSSAVVSLTNVAAIYLRDKYPIELKRKQISIIPTCADLNRFIPRQSLANETKTYGCVGTVLSGWFRLDWLLTFFDTIAQADPDAQFELVTRDDRQVIGNEISRYRALENRITVYSKESTQVHKALQRHTASAMFYKGGEISELGRSPTRMGEVLGCGIPIITNEGIGDVAKIIRRYNVGVLVEHNTPEAMEAAIRNLEVLLSDHDLPARCRRAAEDIFSLRRGINAYRALYRRLLPYTEFTQ